MYKSEMSIFVNRPLQTVFDYVSNFANIPKWANSVESAELTSNGPLGVGSTYKTVGRLLGLKIEGAVEITRWDPPNLFSYKSVSGM